MPPNPKHPPPERIVFVDTSAIAAVMNKTDQYHMQAVTQYKALVTNGYSLVITNFVIAETHALLLHTTQNISLGLRWLMEVAYTDFTVVRPSATEEEAAKKLLTTHTDKEWSLVDALSFTVMEKLAIPYYFSFDDDFRQTGKFFDITRYVERD
jgi:predicted nucleic acid-binding protein